MRRASFKCENCGNYSGLKHRWRISILSFWKHCKLLGNKRIVANLYKEENVRITITVKRGILMKKD
jgi:hypothetical protein